MSITGRDEPGPDRITYAMVGGGQGAFIGGVHRIAARLDDQFTLVAGALSSDPARAVASALALGIPYERAYGSFEDMIAAEALRPDRPEAIVIVTPNHMHFAPAKAALEAGFHVICDKPLTTTLAEARALAEVVERTGRVFVVTHNYTGYPMIRHARAMVAAGELGRIRVVQAEYAQGWLATRLEESGHKQAAWRTDPAKSGAGGAIGDIGTHALNLASFVSGLSLESVCAELSRFVDGRALDDDAQILLRFRGGARGMLWASQVAIGNENALKLRIFGEKGGLAWEQEQPNDLWWSPLGEPTRKLTRGTGAVGPEGARVTRIPSGHPEGYLEGFATLYAEAAHAIRAARSGTPAPAEVVFPTVTDGVAGLAFIEAAVASSAAGGTWTPVEA
jgi:predicted dehydrogenase